MRAVAGRPVTLRYHLTDDVGAPLAPDGGTGVGQVTVTVTAGDATTVLYNNQPATYVSGDSAWEWVLPPQANLDSLTVAWTATVAGVSWSQTDTVDVIARRLVEPYLARADSDIAQLSAEQQNQLADQCEEYVRSVLGYPPVLEGARVVWDVLRGTLSDALYVSGTVSGLPYGWGAGKMLIPGVKFPAQVYSGTINGVALDPTNDIAKLLIESGCLIWSDYRPWISGRYSLWLTHGEARPARDLRVSALRMMKHYSQTSNIPDRAAQVTTEGATILFNLPGPDRPTGIPEVDAVLARYRLAAVI